MPYNGAGSFSPPGASFPAVSNTLIEASKFNAVINDIATNGLSNVITKDGQTTVTANIPLAGFKFTGLGAGTAAGNSVRFEQVLASTVGGSIPYAPSTGATALTFIPALNSTIYGNTYSNNGSDATNDIDIAAGGCIDATGAYWMTCTALTKRSDASWAVGTNAGWLDTGAIGNSDYYIWRIARSDTGVVDSLCSLSSTAPTMPANYDFKRLIGWFKRVGGTIVAFHTYETEGGGLELSWDVPTLDISLANTLTTSRRTDAVKVPLNFSTTATINVEIFDASAGPVVNICCPDQTDAAPSTTVAPLGVQAPATGANGMFTMRVRTSATGTIAARSNVATVDLYAVSTVGFIWARRT